MKLPKGTLQKVAEHFVSRLREELTHEEFEAMRVANSAEASSRFCHSHDYCDADMIMFETIEEVTGISPIVPHLDHPRPVWRESWALASKIIAENTIPEVE
jgi:hypothetical protein